MSVAANSSAGPSTPGRLAVIGAGMTGLVAAYRLALAGRAVDVYERWPGLGGQVATVDLGAEEPVERYYHHLFESDHHIAALYEELGMADSIEWHRSRVAMFSGGQLRPFVGPLDLLRYRPLSLSSRLRLGLGVLRILRSHSGAADHDDETARDWIVREMGTEVWELIWGPLLRGKFGDRADEISMAWLWRRITVRRHAEGKSSRRELLGYPRGSWQPLLDRLRAEIESRGGRVMIDRPAARVERPNGRLRIVAGRSDAWRLGHDPRVFPAEASGEEYDAAIATVPNDTFKALLGAELVREVGRPYLDLLDQVDYHGALCVLLELDRPFSDYYWTNMADTKIPFLGLVEHTNLIDPDRYGGRHLLYVANYVGPDDPLLQRSPAELLEAYEPGLREVNPQFRREWVRECLVFREPAAQPIVTVGYGSRIPPLRTGATGLFLANTTQIFPEDRGTNYSVELGGRVAAAVLESTP